LIRGLHASINLFSLSYLLKQIPFFIHTVENMVAMRGGVVALLVGHWTCNSLVAALSPAWAPLRSTCLGQATYTCVPLSPSSIIWDWPMVKGGNACGWEGNCGPAESNGSLPLG